MVDLYDLPWYPAEVFGEIRIMADEWPQAVRVATVSDKAFAEYVCHLHNRELRKNDGEG